MSSKKTRGELLYALDRQSWCCRYCRKKCTIGICESGEELWSQATRDHLVAAAKGGRKIVAACRRCNNLKADFGEDRFTAVIHCLLQNPHIDAVWHEDIPGLQKILFKIVQVERWKDKQKTKPNRWRLKRIQEVTVEVQRLIFQLSREK